MVLYMDIRDPNGSRAVCCDQLAYCMAGSGGTWLAAMLVMNVAPRHEQN